MKKIFLALLLTLTIFNLTGCTEKKETISKEDSLKFKEEYESLNGKKNENNDKEYRSISISEDNPFVYKEADDIIEMINNKETFALYFGFDSCPWCRSVVPTLIEAAKDTDIEKIYYVDVKEIRDTIEINEDGELEITKKGTDGYYKLIELLDNVLNDYTLVDSDGNKVSTNEKRIYAPNVVIVVDGKAKRLESGVSEKQTDGYMELTDEVKEDTYNKYIDILEYMKSKQNSCNSSC